MASNENYLRAIYELTQNGEGGTTTTEVAEKLEVSPASVSEAIDKLENENLVCRAPYKGFTLSPMGRNKGQKLMEKYETLQKFFQEKLGLQNPDDEADEVEHAISEEAVQKLKNLTD